MATNAPMTPLETLTDEQLCEVFALEIGGWLTRIATHANPVEQGGYRLPNYFGPDIKAWWHPSHEVHKGVYVTPPPFADSADAVLPFMPNDFHGHFWTADAGFMGARVCIRDAQGLIVAEAKSETLARSMAECRVLAKRKGVV